MISDGFRCFPTVFRLFSDCFPIVVRLFSDDIFRLLKSFSSWSKLSMIGPQLFSGWYQMILDVFQCSQLFSDVFQLFSDCFLTVFSTVFRRCFPTVEFLFKWNLDIYDGSSVVLRMIPDGFRCFPTVFWLFSDCFPTVLRLFSDDVFQLLKSSSSGT